MTVDQLGYLSGVSRTTLGKLEADTGYEPHGDTMVKLATYFGVPLHELFYIDEPRAVTVLTDPPATYSANDIEPTPTPTHAGDKL